MEIIEKPWGTEEILEKNGRYVVKRLFMRGGNRCSEQYHKKKTETIYILVGIMLLTINGKTMELSPGDHVTIHPGTVHRMRGITDIKYLEASTTELYDVVRIEDDYGRE